MFLLSIHCWNKIINQVNNGNLVSLLLVHFTAPPNAPISVFDVANKIDEFDFKCPAGVSVEQRFCFRTLFDNNPFFKLVYANEVFSVLKRLDVLSLDHQAAAIEGRIKEYKSFDWKNKVRRE